MSTNTQPDDPTRSGTRRDFELQHLDDTGVMSRPRRWRYNPTVGLLHRVATVLLVFLLASSSTVAALCEALCLPTVSATQAAEMETAHTEHHHPAPGGTNSQHAAPGHRQHQSAAAGPDISARVPLLSQLVGSDCCSQLPQRPLPQFSLAASRSDSDLLPQSHDAVVAPAALMAVEDQPPAAHGDAAPPGQQSLVRTPLVLRI